MVVALLQVLGWFVSQPGNMDKLKRRWWAFAIYGNIVTYRHYGNIPYKFFFSALCLSQLPFAKRIL